MMLRGGMTADHDEVGPYGEAAIAPVEGRTEGVLVDGGLVRTL